MNKLLKLVRSSRTAAVVAASAGVWALTGAASVAQARDNVYWSIGVNSPGVSVGVTNTRPVAVYPAPVVVHSPPPVIYHPMPSRSVRPVVVHTPPPVVVYGPPPRHHRHWDRHPGKGHKHGHRRWRDDDDRDDHRRGGRHYYSD